MKVKGCGLISKVWRNPKHELNETVSSNYFMLHRYFKMRLKSYEAGKGDSFLLTWGEEPDRHHVLIDGGIQNTYRFIRQDLKVINKLDGVIITHVDYDHLGGFEKLLSDATIILESNFPVYMNTPSLALMPAESDKVGLEHGIKLDIKLKEINIDIFSLYDGFSPDNILNINDLIIQVLTPPRYVLDQLLKKWTANEIYQKYIQDSKASDMVGRPSEELISYYDVINNTESVHKWDKDLINSSSMSFIVSYAGCSMLLLGDANPNLIYAELSRLGYSSLNKLNVDLVKLSHHGCKHNSSKDLFSVLKCDSYLISTNGTGPYYHPDRETIIRLAEYSRTSKDERLYIYFNYDLDTSNFITEEEITAWNIQLAHQNIFNFSD